eukprot:5197463-Pleurochrysis_carterae.AAC.1
MRISCPGAISKRRRCVVGMLPHLAGAISPVAHRILFRKGCAGRHARTFAQTQGHGVPCRAV